MHGMEKMIDHKPFTSLRWSYPSRSSYKRVIAYLQKDLAAAPVSDPALDRDDLHEVVSQRNREDRYSGHVEHWVELAYRSNDRNVLEVFIEELIYTAWEMSAIWISTTVW